MSDNPSPYKPTLTDVQSIMAAGAGIAGRIDIPAGDFPIPALVLPHGYTAKTYEDLLPVPIRTEAHPTFTEAGSFADYIKTFKLDSTVVFASVKEASAEFTAIIDYHSKVDARWCSHRAALVCLKTYEWKTWEEWANRKMAQVDFGQFLENCEPFLSPASAAKLPFYVPAAELRELAMNLEITQSVRWASTQRLANGRIHFSYENNTESKGLNNPVEPPQLIYAGINPFVGMNTFPLVTARLRYRLESGKAVFWYETINPAAIIRAAVLDIVKLITDKTGLIPFMGSPS